jgi:hypothetical protein
LKLVWYLKSWAIFMEPPWQQSFTLHNLKSSWWINSLEIKLELYHVPSSCVQESSIVNKSGSDPYHSLMAPLVKPMGNLSNGSTTNTAMDGFMA